MTAWTDAFAAADLVPGGVRVVRTPTDQIAVFRLEDGSLRAVDNRCPHEGFPLAQGTRCGLTLTCCWHNFKFDLTDGACLKGDERVRTFATREVDGRVQVDTTPPDRAAELPRRWRGLDEALHAWRTGQATREAARLLQAGVTPEAILGAVVARDGRRAEWGTTHVLPLATDLLGYLPRYPGIRAVDPLAWCLDLCGLATVRAPERDIPEPEAPGPDAAAELVRRVEAEDARGAEALVRGMVAAGWGRDRIEPALLDLCAAHFLDFGHALIYAVKVWPLLARVDPVLHADILGGLVAGIAWGTREDLLPGWRRFVARMDAFEALDLPDPDPGWRPEPLIDALIRLAPSAALDVVADALRSGAPPLAVAGALQATAAERILRFDHAIDASLDVQDTWLAVTHTLTFATAVVDAIPRRPAHTLRWLAYAVRFVAHHRVLDGPRPAWTAAPGDLASAIADGRAPDALAAAEHALAVDPTALRHTLEDLALAAPTLRPIGIAHAVKTLAAGFDMWDGTGDPRGVLGVVRWLASPTRGRGTLRQAREAVALVRDGRTPKRLAP